MHIMSIYSSCTLHCKGDVKKNNNILNCLIFPSKSIIIIDQEENARQLRKWLSKVVSTLAEKLKCRLALRFKTRHLRASKKINPPVTEGKKIASKMKNDVVMSDLTSPLYEPASIPGTTSSFLRYLLFQLSTR